MKLFPSHPRTAFAAFKRRARGFTMIEIAICLAIIGVALVGIIGVLPYGMNTQRDNREETVIGQDANVLMEMIRNGARGADDLTNYVYAIVNTGSNNMVGYLNPGLATKMGFSTTAYPTITRWYPFLTNGEKIVGLLSQPVYTDNNFNPIPSVMFGGISNHVVAYVRSISGLAAEKPPQDNDIMTGDSFSYRIYCVNAPVDINTNLFCVYPLWSSSLSYVPGKQVLDTRSFTYWQAIANTTAGDEPGFNPSEWQKIPYYPLELASRQHDVRLTFLWPQLPNGNLGSGRQTFRSSVAGQVQHQFIDTSHITGGLDLFFYEPQTFTPSP